MLTLSLHPCRGRLCGFRLPCTHSPFFLSLGLSTPQSLHVAGSSAPFTVVGKQRARLPLNAFHTVGTVSGSGMSTCPKVTHLGPLFPLIC